MKRVTLTAKKYSIENIYKFSKVQYHISLSKELKNNIIESRQFLNDKINEDKSIYGINTGFGKLSSIKINQKDINKLQENLILSHAVGVGDNIPNEIVRIIILLKVLSFTKGNSGIRIEVVDLLLNLLNNNCLPLIPLKGSVGASGDLAPLAHMSLPLIGLGEVSFKNQIMSSSAAFEELNISSIKLEAKEGLALINGTQFSTAYGVYSIDKLIKLFKLSDISASMSIEALKCSKKPFFDYVNLVKPYKGQMDTCTNIINLLENSEIMDEHKNCTRVQDMYSIRCIPQVHGSARDLLYFSKKQLNIEINSVSDNPLVFINQNQIVSAGQFHAEAVAHSLDVAAISIASLSNLSERRIFSLLKGDFGLPEFLIKEPGLNSGFMMLQVTAAALASENKLLSNPSSSDSIPTCSDQEDYVSMAPYSGRKLLDAVNNLQMILAIELLCACQGLDFRFGLKPSKILNILHELIRENIKHLGQDRLLKNDFNIMMELINNNILFDRIKKEITLI